MEQPKKKHISISQIGTFTTCAYKWHVTYERGIRVKRGDVSPSALGSVTHEAIAAGLKALWKYKTSNEDWTVEGFYGEIEKDMIVAIFLWDKDNRPQDKTQLVMLDEDTVSFVPDINFYSAWDDMLWTASQLAIRTLRHIRIVEDYVILTMPDGTPAVEIWLEADIPDSDYEFAGIADLVAYNRITDVNEVIDWKVRGRFSGLEAEQLSMQLGLYQHVLREQYGIDAPFGIVYQIRNEAPATPTLNANGTMSRRKITSDWPMYREALKEAGLDPADYIDEMQPKLADVEFWRPLTVVRMPDVTQKLWDNMVMHARNISKQTEYPRAYGYACRFCPFADLCNAELYDHDTQALFENKYTLTDWSSETFDDEESEE